MLSVKQGRIKNHFLCLWYDSTWDWTQVSQASSEYSNHHVNVQMSRVFANGPGDLGSVAGRVIPKTQKMVLDTALPSTQHYKVMVKSKVEESWEWSSALPYTLV